MKKPFPKGLYYFALFTWVATFCMGILSLLLPLPRLWIVGSFLCSVVQLLFLFKYDDGTPWKWGNVYSPFDRFLRALFCVVCVTFLVCFASLHIAGGGPEMVDGIRCVIDHGQVVRENVSEGFFLYLTTCENTLFFCCLPLFLSTHILWRFHVMYLTGEKDYEQECTDHR